MRDWMRTTWLLVGIGMVAAGCGNSVEPISNGSLLVRWSVRPHGCDRAGVTAVEARLDSKHSHRVERFDCARDEGVVENLRPGNYDVVLVGVDESGNPTYDAGPRRATVRGSREAKAPKMRLTARPAGVKVSWRFANGKVCGSNGVDKVRIVLYDEDDYEVASRSLGCQRGQTTLDDVPPGEYLVEVRSGDGAEKTWVGFEKTELERGKTGTAEVVLKSSGAVRPEN
ncbi:MAG: hypothetical protein ABEL76_15120 [Bradymonadaceae bacterium]